MEAPRVYLKPRQEKRAEEGHLWIFSNEIDKAEEDVQPGGLVDIYSSRSKFIGRGFCNPHSLIALRILSRTPQAIDEYFFVNKFKAALALREDVFPGESFYRLVFGESDFLPGLVIDRLGDVFVSQSNCLGMDALQPQIFSALKTVFSPRAILKKNDSSIRALEGLKDDVEIVHGSIDGPIEVVQGFHGKSLKFLADLAGGQKTGFFFDQRENRVRLSFYAKGKDVLDCYSYTGGFGVHAAAGGAKSVTCVDSSEAACDIAKKNFELNGHKGAVLNEEAETALERFQTEKRQFDIIVLDPPALAKSKKNFFAALRKYGQLNKMAMACLKPGGILISCSCSHHMRREDFVKMISDAGSESGRAVRLLEMRGQSRDHPVLLGMPETEYLKCAILRVD